jgi:hypothetical protein
MQRLSESRKSVNVNVISKTNVKAAFGNYRGSQLNIGSKIWCRLEVFHAIYYEILWSVTFCSMTREQLKF